MNGGELLARIAAALEEYEKDNRGPPGPPGPPGPQGPAGTWPGEEVVLRREEERLKNPWTEKDASDAVENPPSTGVASNKVLVDDGRTVAFNAQGEVHALGVRMSGMESDAKLAEARAAQDREAMTRVFKKAQDVEREVEKLRNEFAGVIDDIEASVRKLKEYVEFDG